MFFKNWDNWIRFWWQLNSLSYYWSITFWHIYFFKEAGSRKPSFRAAGLSSLPSIPLPTTLSFFSPVFALVQRSARVFEFFVLTTRRQLYIKKAILTGERLDAEMALLHKIREQDVNSVSTSKKEIKMT